MLIELTDDEVKFLVTLFDYADYIGRSETIDERVFITSITTKLGETRWR